jgi:DNA invertase Pin-like site-specific DNA recombinase
MQRERILQYAPFAQLEIVDVLIDDGVSGGKPLDKRPAGKQLLERVRSGEVDAIVALRLDRVFRDTLDALDTVKRLDAMNIAVHFVDFGGQAFDSTTSVGKLFFVMQVAFAEFERQRIAERVRENKESRKANGRTYAVPQFGKQNLEGRVEVLDEETVLLREMQEMRTDGWGYKRIAANLNERGVPPKQHGLQWYPATVRNILQREHACDASRSK